MKLPLKWLKEYVDYNVTNEEFVELLMKRGFETAEVADEMPGIKNVVVCTIKSIVPHPDAKKLRICSVDIGEKLPLQIVTNSQRVFEGAQVAIDTVDDVEYQSLCPQCWYREYRAFLARHPKVKP